MYDYISIRINSNPCNETITDLLADSLAEIGFETFEPDNNGVTAYIRKDLYRRSDVEEILRDFIIEASFSLSEEIIEGEDWNREWEQNYFQPIVIDDKCIVRSSFHNDTRKCPIEILIDPKMAFGTGHHATTAGMMRLLMNSDLNGKNVIDMGTGTGILAILCKKLGANTVSAIEIDPFALANAEENGVLNNVEVNWICGDANALDKLQNVDCFLANINLNVIIGDFSKYMAKINSGGYLFLSGFYEYDLDRIMREAEKFNLIKESVNIENEWVAVKFKKML